MCIPIGGDPSARVDLPSSRDEIEAWLAPLTDTYLHTHHPRRIALVAYAEDGPRAVETLARLSDALAEEGPDVGPVLWVKCEEWTELLTATRGSRPVHVRASMRSSLCEAGSCHWTPERSSRRNEGRLTRRRRASPPYLGTVP